MTLLDATTTLVDAARQLPPTKHLEAAIRRVEQRIDLLRARKVRRDWLAQRRLQLLPDKCAVCGENFVEAADGLTLLCRNCNSLACPECGGRSLGTITHRGAILMACEACGVLGSVGQVIDGQREFQPVEAR